jgi:type I restriction enzyme S subunit
MARAMKESGVEWIGEIPEEWTVVRIGAQYTERKTKVSDTEYPPLSVTMKGILPQLATAAKTDAHDDRKLVCKGDFAINSRSDRRGSCGISPFGGSVSLINIILSPREEMNPQYYNWLFHSSMFSDEFYKWGHGIVDDLWTTNWQDMKKISIPEPPLAEQQKIASYLNHQCAAIDAVLEKTRASIEEYKKLKQAVITEAVTKGIRGDRQMKDSGIAWIGEIPEEWSISRVGLHYDVILGKMLCSEQPSDDYSLEKYYCAANVHFDGISLKEDLKQMWFSPMEKMLYRVTNGDMLVVEGGAGAGGAAIVKEASDEVYIQNSIMIVRNKSLGDNRYLRYLIEYLVKSGYVDFVCNKATIPHFTKDKLANVPYPVLTITEMNEIADYLDQKCSAIDALIAKKTQFLTELETYKKSLIYEVVTGKREVHL